MQSQWPGGFHCHLAVRILHTCAAVKKVEYVLNQCDMLLVFTSTEGCLVIQGREAGYSSGDRESSDKIASQVCTCK
jgi:hypothetical protein